MAMNHIDSDELTIIMNDDFFAIKHFSFVNMPLWYDMTIHQRANKQGISETYKNNLINSMMLPDDLNFAVHFPMPVRRPDIFKKVLTRCYKRDRDISFRNTYGNQCRLLGDTIEQMDDLKLYEQYKLHEIVALLAGKTWFSIGDRFLTDQNKSILKHLWLRRGLCARWQCYCFTKLVYQSLYKGFRLVRQRLWRQIQRSRHPAGRCQL
jgi:hypothetical protein